MLQPTMDPAAAARRSARRALTRRALGAASLGVTAAALAACGAPAATGGQDKAADKTPVTLEHVDWWGPTTPVLTTYFEGIKKEFEAQHPNVTIAYTFVQGGTTGVREKWVVNAAGGTPHDTSQVSVAFIRDLMEGGMMEPLDTYFAKSPDLAPSNFVDSGKFYNTFEGKHFGVPYDGPAMNVIAYNIQHFKEAGLDPSARSTWNWTTDQFIEAATKLVKKEGGRNARGGFPPSGISVTNLLPWLYADGGDFYSKDYSRTLVNSQSGREALQLLVDLRQRYKFQSDVDGAVFENEGYSMSFTGSWTAGYILDKNASISFGFAPIPKGPQGKTPSSQTWTNQWGMTKAGKHKDSAWQWISFVNSEATQERYFAGVMKRVSGRKAFYQSAAWKAVVKDYPALDGIEKMEPISKEYPWVKATPISDETADVWKRVQSGDLGVNDALSQVEQIVNRLLKGG